MVGSSEIAFTVAIATVFVLIYLFYNIFFNKTKEEPSEDQKDTHGDLSFLLIKHMP